jgi:hypothetical protein
MLRRKCGAWHKTAMGQTRKSAVAIVRSGLPPKADSTRTSRQVPWRNASKFLHERNCGILDFCTEDQEQREPLMRNSLWGVTGRESSSRRISTVRIAVAGTALSRPVNLGLRTHANECDLQLQARRLLCEASTRSKYAAIGIASQGYIEFIQSKNAGRTGRNPLGRQGGLEPITILLPISGVRERRITPAKLAAGVKLHYPGAFADRRFEPHGIFAVSEHRNPSTLMMKAHYRAEPWAGQVLRRNE